MSWRNIGNNGGPTVGMNNTNGHRPSPPNKGGPPNNNNNNCPNNGTSRPSDARRHALSLADEGNVSRPLLVLSNLCPIQRYYSIADRLLEAFDVARETRHLDDAYVLGKRYAKFSLETLPKHDYYASSRPELSRLRIDNQRHARRVVECLEDVVKAMDQEELIRQKELERRRKIHEQQMKLLMEKQKKERQKQIQQTAEEKLRRLKMTPKVPHSSSSSLMSVTTGTEATVDKLHGMALGGKKEQDAEGGGGGGSATESTSSSSSSTEQQQQQQQDPKKKKKGRSKSPLKKLKKKKDKTDNKEESSTAPVPQPTDPSAMQSNLTDVTPVPPPPPSYSSLPSSSMNMNNATVFQEEAMDNFAHNFRDALESGSELPQNVMLNGTESEIDMVLPPSYADVAATTSAIDFGGSPLTSVSTTSPPKQKTPTDKPSPEDAPALIGDLKDIFMSEYSQLQKKQKVEVFELNTYQGRNKAPGKDSTNGCTVISPLVVIRHLQAPDGASIPDMAIEQIIDHQAPPILSDVRRKLGLGASALIIPSDVHDCLVDKKLLRQDQFVGAVGGNILDPVHLGQLLQLLQLGSAAEGAENKKQSKQGMGRTKKVGAALFFHEHVISIVKLLRPNSKEECWYDLVDSLPRMKPGNLRGNATRTRCKGVAALEQTIRWYACTKFTESDEKYIDGNVWDDMLCDFDPRVFQAFVWEETV